ncbi:Beta-glucosidase [Phocaeicola salanitronis DSM 18170]|uniref:Beta-glucosidase n=1 Tax=Phocaeicola salanitronis (strain DSM 18170 / JCM 13657 / CCUG 60908 / BL78) TaxID=667015 RepID=F0R434_PHOSB|nr:glycoside hydrolase family 3 C-terminal domain-containing protein [Phocaeicola salanitronis]ADY36650.1 Beta-glucosidase [Phocaeicola salanitronis DSM 18170]
MKKQFFSAAVVAAALCACGPSAPQLGQAPIEDVIGAMTLEEKAHLVVGTGMAGSSGDSAVIGETRNIVPGAAGTTYPIERLGIPAVVLADGPAGLRINPTREGDTATYYCTHFPIGTLLASTWNTDLVESVGKSIGNEVLEYGADVLLAPALNIHRNPLCGRNFEYYSEDPVVSGKIAAAYVRGVQSNGVGTSIKHFAVNNQETNRTGVDARVSQRALREIYLKGFEIAVKEGKPWTVMSSYNYLNGIYTSENPELLNTMLRDEWGFTGMVMTDWFGGKDAVAQMKAGNDMLQPGTDKQYEAIIAGVNEDKLDVAVLDANVKRILEMILQTPHFKGYKYSNKPDLKAHAAVTRQSATEGMVLLKNQANALPLAKEVKNVALFGCTSYDFVAGGTGSGNVNHAYVVSLLDGLKNAGYTVDEGLKNTYETYIKAEQERIAKQKKAWFMPDERPVEMELTTAQIQEQVAKNDVALITIGRTSGEFLDRKVADFNLSKAEKQLLQNVTRAFHAAGKKAIVVLNIGDVIETASWKAMPDAILCAWQAGQEGGNSVADVLSGKASPSGKLPMTFPVQFEDAASSDNFPVDVEGNIDITNKDLKKGNTRNVDYTDYEEDIYVGYRYFDSFNKQVSYPFGYGLSYTTFKYDNPTIEASNGLYTVRVDVTNTGKVSGKEVVQLYVSAPDAAKANKPAKELKAFAKTAELKPGEKASIVLTVNAKDLASFDAATSSWTVSEGEYKFLVGASSRDIKATLKANVAASTEKANDILKPQQELKLLKR